MIDRYEVDDQKEDKQTIKELAAKVNEVIDILASRVSLVTRPPGRVVAPLQLIEYMLAMTTRTISGPFATLVREVKGDDLVTAVGSTLTQLQNALQAYKDSLATKAPG